MKIELEFDVDNLMLETNIDGEVTDIGYYCWEDEKKNKHHCFRVTITQTGPSGEKIHVSKSWSWMSSVDENGKVVSKLNQVNTYEKTAAAMLIERINK